MENFEGLLKRGRIPEVVWTEAIGLLRNGCFPTDEHSRNDTKTDVFLQFLARGVVRFCRLLCGLGSEGRAQAGVSAAVRPFSGLLKNGARASGSLRLNKTPKGEIPVEICFGENLLPWAFRFGND